MSDNELLSADSDIQNDAPSSVIFKSLPKSQSGLSQQSNQAKAETVTRDKEPSEQGAPLSTRAHAAIRLRACLERRNSICRTQRNSNNTTKSNFANAWSCDEEHDEKEQAGSRDVATGKTIRMDTNNMRFGSRGDRPETSDEKDQSSAKAANMQSSITSRFKTSPVGNSAKAPQNWAHEDDYVGDKGT